MVVFLPAREQEDEKPVTNTLLGIYRQGKNWLELGMTCQPLWFLEIRGSRVWTGIPEPSLQSGNLASGRA